MPLGQVKSVNAGKRTISVNVQDRGGTRMYQNVKLMKHVGLPEHLQQVLVINDGGDYYCVGIPETETDAAVEERESAQNVAGDQFIGDPEKGPGLGIRKGGMVVMIANEVTGIIINKIIQVIQFFGERLSWDTTFYHKIIRTLTDKMNTVIDTRVSGTPIPSVLSVEMIKGIVNTQLGTIDIDLSAFKDCEINFKIKPEAMQPVGSNVAMKGETPLGDVEIKWNGTTGVLDVKSPTQIKVDAQAVLVNSDGSPLDRVMTCKDKCWYTGNILGQGSNRLFVGSNLV